MKEVLGREDFPVDLLDVRLKLHSLVFEIEIMPMIAKQVDGAYIRPEHQEIFFNEMLVAIDHSKGSAIGFHVYCLVEDLERAKEILMTHAKRRLAEMTSTLVSMQKGFDEGPKVSTHPNHDLRKLIDNPDLHGECHCH